MNGSVREPENQFARSWIDRENSIVVSRNRLVETREDRMEPERERERERERGRVANSLSMNDRSFRGLEIGCGVNVTFQRASTMAH